MSNEDKFSFESIQDTRSIKAFLQSLMDGIESKRIILTSDTEEMLMHPSDQVKFSIKAKKKGLSQKLTLKLAWKEATKNGPDNGQSITISS